MSNKLPKSFRSHIQQRISSGKWRNGSARGHKRTKMKNVRKRKRQLSSLRQSCPKPETVFTSTLAFIMFSGPWRKGGLMRVSAVCWEALQQSMVAKQENWQSDWRVKIKLSSPSFMSTKLNKSFRSHILWRISSGKGRNGSERRQKWESWKKSLRVMSSQTQLGNHVTSQKLSLLLL